MRRYKLLRALFFATHPSYEVASMGVTAAEAAALRNTAMAAQQVVATANVALKSNGDVDSATFATLTNTMRLLMKILAAILEDAPVLDGLWLTHALCGHDSRPAGERDRAGGQHRQDLRAM